MVSQRSPGADRSRPADRAGATADAPEPDRAGSQRGEEAGVKCPYCKNPMIEIVLGWQCPVCHATLGREKALSR